MKTKVFVTRVNRNQNFDDAKQYGELVFVFEPHISPFQIRTASDIVEELLAENPPSKDDMVLICGPATLSFILIDALLARFGTVTMLVFHARDRVYVKREITRATYNGSDNAGNNSGETESTTQTD